MPAPLRCEPWRRAQRAELLGIRGRARVAGRDDKGRHSDSSTPSTAWQLRSRGEPATTLETAERVPNTVAAIPSRPPTTRSSGCRRNSSRVATPSSASPRSPQRSSAFSSAFARTTSRLESPARRRRGCRRSGRAVRSGDRSAAERKAGHAGGADDPSGRDEAERLSGRVEVEPGRAPFRASDTRSRPPRPCASPQVDHEPVVEDAVSGGVVAASSNGDLQFLRRAKSSAIATSPALRHARSPPAGDRRGR